LEIQRFQEEIDALNVKYGGVKDMRGRPGAVFVTSAVDDRNAVAEAIKLNIPVIAICDTNADPTGVTYPIPANDDAIAALQLITDYVAGAVKAGSAKVVKDNVDKASPKPTDLAGKKVDAEEK
jgi:small subunit ribosomal protein S2